MNTIFEQNSEPKRNSFLTTLCVLTFIWSGLNTFSYFSLYFSWDMLVAMIESGDFPMADMVMPMFEHIDKKFFFISSFLFFCSFLGALMMWRLKRVGFHLYTAAQLFALLLPIVFYRELGFPFLDLLLSALFVAFYWKALNKSLKGL